MRHGWKGACDQSRGPCGAAATGGYGDARARADRASRIGKSRPNRPRIHADQAGGGLIGKIGKKGRASLGRGNKKVAVVIKPHAVRPAGVER